MHATARMNLKNMMLSGKKPDVRRKIRSYSMYMKYPELVDPQRQKADRS